MEITTIKRKLADHGIGDPLNRLFYSGKEIQRDLFIKKNKGLWAIQVGKIIVDKTFISKKSAEEWAEWNYKGRGNYRVILLSPQ